LQARRLKPSRGL